MTGASGGYQVGFQLTPLSVDGNLDAADFKGGPHPVEKDPIYKLCVDNRDSGNKMVQEGKIEEAIARYSELIMQSRALENETDVQWTDEGRDLVRHLRAATYLNLSLCFLKSKQWQHAINTATRALQGDKDPPEPKENVLLPEKKAKALYRRAVALRDGFDKLDEAVKDLKKALEYVPEDKNVQLELQRTNQALAKEKKKSDKKLAGFLSSQSQGGIFSEADRQRDTKGHELPSEPVKVSDGLWVVPKEEKAGRSWDFPLGPAAFLVPRALPLSSGGRRGHPGSQGGWDRSGRARSCHFDALDFRRLLPSGLSRWRVLCGLSH